MNLAPHLIPINGGPIPDVHHPRPSLTMEEGVHQIDPGRRSQEARIEIQIRGGISDPATDAIPVHNSTEEERWTPKKGCRAVDHPLAEQRADPSATHSSLIDHQRGKGNDRNAFLLTYLPQKIDITIPIPTEAKAVPDNDRPRSEPFYQNLARELLRLDRAHFMKVRTDNPIDKVFEELHLHFLREKESRLAPRKDKSRGEGKRVGNPFQPLGTGDLIHLPQNLLVPTVHSIERPYGDHRPTLSLYLHVMMVTQIPIGSQRSATRRASRRDAH